MLINNNHYHQFGEDVDGGQCSTTSDSCDVWQEVEQFASESRRYTWEHLGR